MPKIKKEWIDKILLFLRKNWWQVIFILLAAGLALSSFSFQCGDKKLEKGAIDVFKK